MYVARESLAAFNFLRSIISRILICFVALGFGGIISNTAGAAERSVNIAADQIDRSAKKSERIRLGYSGPSMGNIPLLMAAKKGFLADEGFYI